MSKVREFSWPQAAVGPLPARSPLAVLRGSRLELVQGSFSVLLGFLLLSFSIPLVVLSLSFSFPLVFSVSFPLALLIVNLVRP